VERYVIRGGRAGAARLRVLARTWADTTVALLDRAGVGAGARCLDLGCGAGDVTFEFAARVGSSGRAVGIDMDVEKLALARERAATDGHHRTEFRVGDAYTFETDAGFDVVYCRFLLQHLSRPVDVLVRMWDAVVPGGVLIVEDADFEGSFCFPPNDGFDFWVRSYQAVLRSFGGDPLSGRKLVARFAEAGIPTPELTVVQRADLAEEGRTLPMLTVEATAEAMIDAAVASREEIALALEQLGVFAADQTILCGSPRTFQAWTRRSSAPLPGR
jgi:SAM-dependent methyltransferase